MMTPVAEAINASGVGGGDGGGGDGVGDSSRVMRGLPPRDSKVRRSIIDDTQICHY